MSSILSQQKDFILSTPAIIGITKDIGERLDNSKGSLVAKSLRSSFLCHLDFNPSHFSKHDRDGIEMHLCNLLLGLPHSSLSYLPGPDQMLEFLFCFALNACLNKQKQTLSKEWSPQALDDYSELVVRMQNVVITKQVFYGNCAKYPNKQGSFGTTHPKPSGDLQNLFTSEREKIFSLS